MTEKYYPGHPFVEAIIADAAKFDHIVIDCFCGFGGTTSGFSRAKGYRVIACINHWDVAIETHKKNHPDILHIEEDFRSADLSLVMYMVGKIRLLNPNIKVHIWMSLECTNFSNAKGGMPRDADSRTLADHADRYVIALNPDVIWIENVKEFLLWGPMIPKVVDNSCPVIYNKKRHTFGPWLVPDPERKGEDFEKWKKHIENFGYEGDQIIINAADFGVPQHRIRLFMQFTRPGVGHFWPKPSHSKTGAEGLPKWNPIKDCLDLEDEGTELLDFIINKKTGKRRPRIKSAKTIERLMKGCNKHVLKGEDTFITKHYSGSPENRSYSIKNPAGAVTGTGGNASISKAFIMKYKGNNAKTGINAGKSINDPAITVETSNRCGLATVNMVDYYFGKSIAHGVDNPAGVTGARDGASLHTMKLVSEFHTRGEAASINQPSKPILTKDKYSVDTIRYIDNRYSGGGQHNSVDQPSPSTTGVPKQVPVTVKRMIMDTQFNNGSHSLEEAARTQTANRKHHYIVNFQWCNGNTKDIADVSNTIIARLDKAPTYLIVCETGELAIEIYKHDPPHYKKFKKYMAENGIISVKMRMLKCTELLPIQDLPPDYGLSENSTDNKKMIGNAVPPEPVCRMAIEFDLGLKNYPHENRLD